MQLSIPYALKLVTQRSSSDSPNSKRLSLNFQHASTCVVDVCQARPKKFRPKVTPSVTPANVRNRNSWRHEHRTHVRNLSQNAKPWQCQNVMRRSFTYQNKSDALTVSVDCPKACQVTCDELARKLPVRAMVCISAIMWLRLIRSSWKKSTEIKFLVVFSYFCDVWRNGERTPGPLVRRHGGPPPRCPAPSYIYVTGFCGVAGFCGSYFDLGFFSFKVWKSIEKSEFFDFGDQVGNRV